MIELTYRSQAVDTLDYDDIDSILNTARSFNGEHDITGCLIYHKDHFVQILEGPEGIVSELFEKISSDSRHKNVELLSTGVKQDRDFSSWSMAYQTLVNGPIDNDLLRLFEENLLTMAKFSDLRSDAIRTFWGAVSTMMESKVDRIASQGMRREG